MINKVILSGVLFRPAEVKQVGEYTVANLALLIREGVKRDGTPAEGKFFVSAWNDEARKCEGLQEGQAVTIEGSLRNKKKDDGSWSLEVNAFRVNPF